MYHGCYLFKPTINLDDRDNPLEVDIDGGEGAGLRGPQESPHIFAKRPRVPAKKEPPDVAPGKKSSHVPKKAAKATTKPPTAGAVVKKAGVALSGNGGGGRVQVGTGESRKVEASAASKEAALTALLTSLGTSSDGPAAVETLEDMADAAGSDEEEDATGARTTGDNSNPRSSKTKPLVHHASSSSDKAAVASPISAARDFVNVRKGRDMRSLQRERSPMRGSTACGGGSGGPSVRGSKSPPRASAPGSLGLHRFASFSPIPSLFSLS